MIYDFFFEKCAFNLLSSKYDTWGLFHAGGGMSDAKSSTLIDDARKHEFLISMGELRHYRVIFVNDNNFLKFGRILNLVELGILVASLMY